MRPVHAPPDAAPDGEPPRTAVVVEDDRDIRMLVCLKLGRGGYRTHAAEAGDEGVELVRRERPDVVVLDLMLPRMNGYEVCRRIRAGEDTRDIPVVLLTARAQDADIEQGFAAGADDYITKPFSPRELLSRVDAAVSRGHQPR
jgi:two-component system, OmpR family, phosphate regulon response regulator PhoB